MVIEQPPTTYGCDAVQQLGRHGPWDFTCESVVDGPRAEALHELYLEAFAPLRAQSAARQVLTPTEFFDQLLDPRIDKYIAWADGLMVGLATLTNRLDTVPWVSPEYFAARYPEHWARGGVYYLGFVVAHASLPHQQFLETVVEVGLPRLSAEQAVLAYDVCAYNDHILRFGERVDDLIAGDARIARAAIDTQTYYAVRFG